MSDKPLVQQALADSLAGLLLDVRPKLKRRAVEEGEVGGTGQGRVERFRSALCYLKGFWEAIVREWEGLDRLRCVFPFWKEGRRADPWCFDDDRLDKFYLLIRRFVSVSFTLLQREAWDPNAIAEYNAVLSGPGGPM